MKKLLLLNSAILILHSALVAQSPDWFWAKGIGATNSDAGNSIAIDESGNVYTTGGFNGTVDFDPGPGVFNLSGGGGFISKLDASGNFIWAKATGGNSIAIDTAGGGDVYITGMLWGTGDLDPGQGTYYLTSAGNMDIFVSKLDSSGNFVWAKAMGGTGVDYAGSIAIDPSGSGAVYTTGSFDDTADFDPGPGTFYLTSSGNMDIFISKLDSAGNFVWAKAMGGTLDQFGNSITIDPAGSGDVYTAGTFQGTTDFDPGAGVFNLTVNSFSVIKDIFISKLDSSGNFVWAKAMGGSEDDQGISIAIDHAGSGAVYTTGVFEGTADFDPGPGVFNLTPTPSGLKDIFVSKLDGSGNFVWAKAMGGLYDEWSSSIAIDPRGSGAVYTIGQFGGVVDFDPGAGVFNLTSAGSSDVFISKFDSSGIFVWAKAVGGANTDEGRSIANDALGNVYLTGYFTFPDITFGTTVLTSVGNEDIFIARLDTLTIISDYIEKGNSRKGASVYPNPLTNTATISFSLPHPEIVSVKVFDVNGRLVSDLSDKIFKPGINEIIWNAEDVNAGIYFLQVQSENISVTEKISVVK